MSVILPDYNSGLNPENVNELRYAVRRFNDSGFIFMLNFQDHTRTKDIENIQFILKTAANELRIPESSGFTLKSEENAIFPFNFDMEGINLNYATAQLLTRFNNAKDQYYVFFYPEGIIPEFSLDRTSGVTIEPVNCKLEENTVRFLVKCNNKEPGQFTINKPDGSKIKVLVIDRDNALKLWLCEIEGNKYLIFSDALVLKNGQLLEFYNRDKNNFEFKIYPSLESIPEADHGKIEILSEKNDLFSHYKLTLPEVKINEAIQEVSDNKITLIIPSEKPEGVNDIFLRINYIGDTGLGFLNGELVADDFYYGSDWEIGLKRFMDRPGIKEMVLYFRPLYKEAPFYEDFAPELIPDFSQSQSILKIYNTEFIPEYKTIVRFK
jgi:hypothetical protein